LSMITLLGIVVHWPFSAKLLYPPQKGARKLPL